MDIDVIIFLILTFIVLFFFTVFLVLSYSGLFTEPLVSTGEPPWSKKSVTIAYKYIKGPYNSNEIGATFTEVTSIAPKALCIGIFYDDPHTVQPDRLRSVVGCIIKEGEPDDATDDKPPPVGESELKMLKEKKFLTYKLPEIDLAVVSEFPYTTPFSIWLAPNRVYPRLNHYISSRGLCAYPMIEVYKDCKIFYAAPLSKQEDFFVPESLEEQSDESPSTEATNQTPNVADEEESPNLRTADRGIILSGPVLPKTEENPNPTDGEHEIRSISSLTLENDNNLESRSSRSSTDSSSFEEIETDDLSPLATSSSKKTN